MIYLLKRHESGRLLRCQNPACQKPSNLNIQTMAHTLKPFHSESFLVKCSRLKNLPKLFDLNVLFFKSNQRIADRTRPVSATSAWTLARAAHRDRFAVSAPAAMPVITALSAAARSDLTVIRWSSAALPSTAANFT